MNDGHIPLTITVKPWFYDHHFGGRTILPAVETMVLLASMVVKIYPEVDIRVMEDVRFPSFLEISRSAATLPALSECHLESDGRIRSKLLSRVQLKAMSRIKEHGEVVFSLAGNSAFLENIHLEWPISAEPVIAIGVDRIYRELVPFGPKYHTLQGSLYLSGRRAWGRLKAPELPEEPIQDLIGSPFTLDGALHAACVLGQQTVDFVPFPVGFARRVISRPTQPGVSYQTRIVQTSGTAAELSFDLEIFDDEGRTYETVIGVRMRDVSGAIRK